MFRRGVPKEAIRRLLGHHSWDFTAGTYLHLDDDDLPDGAVVGHLTAMTSLNEVYGSRPSSSSDARSSAVSR
jgi:hypothetical protein